MENTFTIAFEFGTQITFKGVQRKDNFNDMLITSKDERSGLDDTINLSHGEKLAFIKFLIETI